MTLVLLIIAAIMPVIFIIVQTKKGGATGTVFKTIASLCFVGYGLYNMTINPSNFGAYLVFALALGMTGDILIGAFLGNPENEKSNPYLMGGFLTFGIEHITMFVATLHKYEGFSGWFIALALFLGLVFALGTMFIEKMYLKFEFGAFLIPATLYAFAIYSAFALYVITAILHPEYWIVAGGMALFLLSDMLLSFILFNKKTANIWTVFNLLTYYSGQIIFASAIGLLAV